MGGLFGGGNCNGQSELVSAYQAAAANLAAEKYADNVGIELYREIISQSNRADQRLGEYANQLAQGIINLDKKVAAIEATQPLLAEISALKSERYTDSEKIIGMIIPPCVCKVTQNVINSTPTAAMLASNRGYFVYAVSTKGTSAPTS